MRPLPESKLSFVPCDGGCDFVTPVLQQPPGRLRVCKNLEIGINKGYNTVKGYERHDGRTAPSAGTYTMLPATITGTIAVGDAVTGGTSGATGVVVAVEAASVAVTKLVGTFVSGETLLVSASPQATTTADPDPTGAATPLLHATYLAAAADEYRDDIGAVPGAGIVRGVCRYNGVTYAWRNIVGNTAMAIYKSSGSGWTAVALGRELAFTSGGTTEIVEGNTITGATSAATAVITRVVLESGTWGGGDASGRLIFASQTGTFQAENLNVGASLNIATIADNSSAIILSPSGRVKTIIYNFTGSGGTRRIYGADGVNKGFEFDGTVYVPIRTGMTTDTPENVFAHKSHLFFSFGPSVQHSGIATPYIWSPVLGAAEIAMGDDVTGFSLERGSETAGALAILCRNKMALLYGNDSADWVLTQISDEGGAYENTIQSIGYTVMLDDRGVVTLKTSSNYGNFQSATISKGVTPWLNARKNTVTDSCIVREKNQYRIFFADNAALFVTIENGKILGMNVIEYLHAIECIHSVESTSGNEEIFFGSDDGYVYQMEKGTSFDGEAIESYGLLQYYNCGMPRITKHFQSAVAEVAGDGYAEFSLGYELGYGSTDIYQPDVVSDTQSASFTDDRWDEFYWEDFYWDSVNVSPMRFKLAGTAENIGFFFYTSSAIQNPIKISGIVLRYLVRKMMR